MHNGTIYIKIKKDYSLRSLINKKRAFIKILLFLNHQIPYFNAFFAFSNKPCTNSPLLVSVVEIATVPGISFAEG